MKDLETRRKRIELVVKLLALGGISFLISPFIMATIQGLLGLIAALAIGATCITFAPFVAMKFANWRLKALKYEASQNPIETLENQFKERQQALITFRENILQFHAVVQGFYGELEQHKQNYPTQAGKYDEQYSKMKGLLDARGRTYKQAQKKLGEFEHLIEQKRSEWKLAQAAGAMSKAAGVGEDFMSKLMSDTAVDSITTGLNTAFAELDVAMLDEGAETPQLQNRAQSVIAQSGPPVLDLEFAELPTKKTA